MDDLSALHQLADALGVACGYEDGLGRPVSVEAETLVPVCRALGAQLDDVSGAPEALRAHRAALDEPEVPIAPVLVAWDGVLRPVRYRSLDAVTGHLALEGGDTVPLDPMMGTLRCARRLPYGYHTLVVEGAANRWTSSVIAAPTRAWRRPGAHTSWGVGTHLAALRSRRSRSVGDVGDLERTCRFVAEHGGDLVTVLPLLPTFNEPPAECSPYAPVSRLFWSDLVLDLGDAYAIAGPVSSLDVTAAAHEVRRALADRPAPGPDALDDELRRYAAGRGAQAKLGRNWRDWPTGARDGALESEHVDADVERFHQVAQLEVRRQLSVLRDGLDEIGMRLGLDLAVGVHPDGYDAWSRAALFAQHMSVGAPPDPGFPGGQDWGFQPLLPAASQAESHAYVRRSIAHQAALAGVLRVDHVMALSRLYWIPEGLALDQGTYVSYPTDELFAVLVLESHRNRCEVVGENLGTVPDEIRDGLPRHGIGGMYLAIFDAASPHPAPPPDHDLALVGTHDTPTFRGWLEGRDIEARVESGLLDADAAPAELEAREVAAAQLAETVGGSVDDPADLFERLLDWLGRSESPLVVPWLEDLWLEPDQVNLPGTRSSERPNWQRPMDRLLDDALRDPDVVRRLTLLNEARTR
jgi:4-alpha-glucanotransferase